MCEGPPGLDGADGVNGVDGVDGFDGASDKQIRLIIVDMGFGTGTGAGSEGRLIGELIKFNKNNYSNVDSIIFSPRFDTPPGKQTKVQLYNVTDDVVISNSRVVANNPEPANVDSDNIFDDLPDEEITLSMLVKNGTVWGQSYLFLYRD